MARRRRNANDEGIRLLFVAGGGVVLFSMVSPSFREAVLSIGKIALSVVVLAILGVIGFPVVRKMMNNRKSSSGNAGTREMHRENQPLRSFNMSTLESVAAKPNAPSPAPNDDCRFQPKVWVSPSPIINYASSPAEVDTMANGRPRFIPTATQADKQSSSTRDLIEKFRTIDWYPFEKVVALVFELQGYRVVRRGGANPDGGIDMVVEKGGERTGIQCKQWKGWKLPEKTVREFVGALHIEGIHKGALVILSGCTGPAKALALARGIIIIEEQNLVEMLGAVGALHNPEIWKLLNDKRKFCPKCDSETVVRTTRKGENAGAQFWGCSTYPRCNYMMPIS